MKSFLLIIFSCLLLTACGIKERETIQKIETEEERIAVAPITYISASEVSYNQNIQLNSTDDEQYDFKTALYQLLREERTKEIKEGIFQTVLIENITAKEKSINFYTWSKNEETISVIDKIMFNDIDAYYGKQLGQFYLELWEDNEHFFLSYHDLTLDESFLSEAEKGKMTSSPIQIGMSKDQLISLVGEPLVIDWYSGGHYYYYNEIAYILDESLTVVAINMPGQRVNEHISAVFELFGTPSSETYSEMDNNYLYSYHFNEYTLSFEAFNKDEEVINIWVTRN